MFHILNCGFIIMPKIMKYGQTCPKLPKLHATLKYPKLFPRKKKSFFVKGRLETFPAFLREKLFKKKELPLTL